MKSLYLLLPLFLAGWTTLQAQPKYWILLKDKSAEGYQFRENLSAAAIEKRQRLGLPLFQYTDVPLNKEYLQALESKKICLLAKSKWLNAVSARLTEEQRSRVLGQPYVSGVRLIGHRNGGAQSLALPKDKLQQLPSSEQAAMAWALRQINPDPFFKKGLSGKGVRVGVIDAGFIGAQKSKKLQHLFQDSLILVVRDFLDPSKTKHFTDASTHSDWHGAMVLESIAGKEEDKNKLYGLATNASLVLARTEHGDREFRGEEDLWVQALEWMDSLGVRLVNTSLGYGMDFDDPKENYTPEQMDGSTALISKAAQIAVEEKGVFIVASAGNEGMNKDWKVVSAPADAPGVLAVGATSKVGFKASYSSLGPSFLPYLKPDVSCHSSNGTSFSAPIIAGFVACLIEAFPSASNRELIQAVRQSAYLYPYGNRQVGYGVPQAGEAMSILANKETTRDFEDIRAKNKRKVVFRKTRKRETPWSTAVLIFHKLGEHEVVKDKVMRTKKRKIRIKRPKSGVTQTTVLFPDNSGAEIFWLEK